MHVAASLGSARAAASFCSSSFLSLRSLRNRLEVLGDVRHGVLDDLDARDGVLELIRERGEVHGVP